MMTNDYFLLLDSNVWIAERLLYSTLGRAILFALTQANAELALPEIVEKEVNFITMEQAETAAKTIQKSSALLQQISGHRMSIMAPSSNALKEGIDRRWIELSGRIHRVPMTLELMQGAVEAIIRKLPPCGPNNEQFRDCCIWQTAKLLASICPVHVVSNDYAFYEGGKKSAGLAAALKAEVNVAGSPIFLYPTLSEFLQSNIQHTTELNETALRNAIVDAVTPDARALAQDADKMGNFELGGVRKFRITGYSTPNNSTVAVSFSVKFDFSTIIVADTAERTISGLLSIEGQCSLEPNSGVLTDIEISEWDKSVNYEGGGFSSQSGPSARFQNQYSQGKMRYL